MIPGRIEAKSILVRSKLPDADYVVNPYTGCAFGCQYCYATFTGRFVQQPIQAWGDYVYAKANAGSLFARELVTLRRNGRAPSLLLSSVTDPYQGAERRYRLTRGILVKLAEEPYPGRVGIVTKSPLVLRDADLLRALPRVEVGLTVTTTDDRLGRLLEVHAPRASRRLATLAALRAHGIAIYAFVGPLLPHFRYERAALDALFGGLAHAGVRAVYVEHLNVSPYIRQRLMRHLRAERREVQDVYRDAGTREHRAALDQIVAELLQAHDLTLRLSRVLYHPSDSRRDVTPGVPQP
jgi:DNA repair photolyase